MALRSAMIVDKLLCEANEISSWLPAIRSINKDKMYQYKRVGGHYCRKIKKQPMIKFFRRIRQRLLDEGSLKRYIIYAIGEIILVVIGILIAVKLNNWNQERIRKDEIENLLDKVEEDLARNIKHFNSIINVYQVNDSLTRKVINNQVTLEDYYRDNDLENLLFRFQFLNITYENIEKIIETEENINSKYGKVIEAAKELLRANIYDELSGKPVIDFYNKNVDFKMSHPLWMVKSDSLSIIKRYNYFLTDENYKKQVLNYWGKTSFMVLTLMYSRSATMELLGRLKIIRHNYDVDQLNQLFKSLNLNSFTMMDCQDVVPRNKDQHYRNERFLVANLSQEQVHLFLKNSNDEIILERKLKPDEYSIFMETQFGVEDIDEDFFSIIEVRKDGQCLKKYAESINGYLLLE
ncbi:MAG: hypothetical protein KDC92_16755 [Bacteroidetes bacterium]|nr:hypothetical protein [Bacteroidota bacterium]